MPSLPIQALILSLAASIASAGDIPVHIQHRFGSEPLITDSLRFSNNAGETLSITRLSYLLSGFEVRSEDNTWFALPEQHAWVDAGRRRTSFLLRGVPAAEIRALRFRIGPDPKTNATDPQNLPADHPLNPLHWSW